MSVVFSVVVLAKYKNPPSPRFGSCKSTKVFILIWILDQLKTKPTLTFSHFYFYPKQTRKKIYATGSTRTHSLTTCDMFYINLENAECAFDWTLTSGHARTCLYCFPRDDYKYISSCNFLCLFECFSSLYKLDTIGKRVKWSKQTVIVSPQEYI